MLGPSDIRLVIMEVQRPREYIHTALASLFMSDPLVHELKGVHLMVGNAHIQHLSPYFQHRRLQIHSIPAAESERIEHWPPLRRLALNFHRCLTVPPLDCAGFCICENDVIFRDGFLSEMLVAINELESNPATGKYLLDAYLPYGFRRESTVDGLNAATRYYAKWFYGTQCVYYPAAVVSELAQRIYQESVGGRGVPIDMLVRDFAVKENSLFGPKRSLTQHIGFHSSNPGAFFHQAPSFADNVPALEPFPVAPFEDCSEAVNFELRDSLAAAVRQLGWHATWHGAELVFLDEFETPGTIIGDAATLVRLLSRLTYHAIQLSKGGEVVLRIAAEREDEAGALLRFSVSDCRHPVMPGQRSTPGRGESGNEVLRMVDLLGGKFWWEHSPTGRGMTCHFLARFGRGVAADRPSCRGTFQELRGRRILVVDDSAANRRLLFLLLSGLGAAPVCTSSASEALPELYRSKEVGQAYWLALVDAEMPEVNGLELVRRMRQMAAPVGRTVLMTPVSPTPVEPKGLQRAQLRDAGIANLLAKPVLHNELCQALRHFLTGQPDTLV